MNTSQDGGGDENGVGRGESDEDHVDGRLHLRPAQHHDRYHVAHQAQQAASRIGTFTLYRGDRPTVEFSQLEST